MGIVSFIKRVVLLIILIYIPLSASEIKITNFKISKAIDTKKMEPINPSNSFDTNTKTVSASAVIHNIFPPTKFTMVWYYEIDKKKIYLLKHKFQISGTRFIYNTIEGKNSKPLFVGRYIVEIRMNRKIIASKEFTIGKVTKKRDKICLKPSLADDKNFVADILRRYPISKSEFDSMELKRFKTKSFSLILPSKGDRLKSSSPSVLLSLANTFNNIYIAYFLRKLPIDVNLLQKLSPRKSLFGVSEVIKENAIKRGVSLALKLKIFPMGDITVGRMAFIKDDLYELHTLINDKKSIFDLVVVTDNRGLQLAKFISTLAFYSFWTVNSCKE